jgi:hypothetical protein
MKNPANLWGEIEGFWSRIFQHLLFFDFRFAPFDKPTPDQELPTKETRAATLWDTVLSSKTQMDMVIAIAPIAITLPALQGLLKKLLNAAAATNETRGLRNALAHASFERKVRQTVTGDEPNWVQISVEPLGVGLTARPHKRIRGQAPHVALPKIIEEFEALLKTVSGIHFELSAQWAARAPYIAR